MIAASMGIVMKIAIAEAVTIDAIIQEDIATEYTECIEQYIIQQEGLM